MKVKANFFKSLFLIYIISLYQTKKQFVPTINFMWKKISHIIAFGFGSGLTTFLPGTIGTIAGWAVFKFSNMYAMNPISFAIFFGLILIISSWACSQTQKSMNQLDSGHIVIDEWLGIWLCLWFLQQGLDKGFLYQLGVFLVFRFFDMVKPFPIRKIELKMKTQGIYGGFGIMLDDILASVYTIFLISIFS